MAIDLKTEIQHYYYLYFKTPKNNIKEGVKNLFFWFGVIWNNRDWDHTFLYIVLRFKLKRMLNYFEKHGHSNHTKTIKDIKICISLIDTILKDNFLPDFDILSVHNITKHKFWVIEHKRKQKYIDLLFKIMSKYSIGWWD